MGTDVTQRRMLIKDISINHEAECHLARRTEIYRTMHPDSNGGEGVKTLSTIVWQRDRAKLA